MDGTATIVQDPTLPLGRCVVLIDGDIVYAGRIGIPMIQYIDQHGAVLIVSPADYAAFVADMKAMARPN